MSGVMVDRELLERLAGHAGALSNADTTHEQRNAAAVDATAARAALAAHAEALERERWIPVGERLPEELKYVLFYSPATYWRGCHNVGYLLPNGEWHGQGFHQPLTPTFVTHWRPLPVPPALASAEGGAE